MYFGQDVRFLEIYKKFNKILKYLDLLGKLRLENKLLAKFLKFWKYLELLGKFLIVLTVMDFRESFEIDKEVV